MFAPQHLIAFTDLNSGHFVPHMTAVSDCLLSAGLQPRSADHTLPVNNTGDLLSRETLAIQVIRSSFAHPPSAQMHTACGLVLSPTTTQTLPISRRVSRRECSFQSQTGASVRAHQHLNRFANLNSDHLCPAGLRLVSAWITNPDQRTIHIAGEEHRHLPSAAPLRLKGDFLPY